MGKVNGRNYTSNSSKLLKHLDKLELLQDGIPTGPVMVHLALTNNCNLNCNYCCYGGRNKKEELTLGQAKAVIDGFSELGTRGLEITGGGDPLLHPDVNEIVRYGKSKGMSIGLISNGVAYDKFTEWDKLEWIRFSSHVLNKPNDALVEKFTNAILKAKEYSNIDLGSVHIYHGDNQALDNVVRFMEFYKVPTRITPDLTKDNAWIEENMLKVADLLENKYNSEFCFVSDFNFKTKKDASTCWMRFVKPYVHADGFVYECPGASFSPENYRTVDDKYRICDISDIVKTYTDSKLLEPKSYGCKLCKYDYQNMLMEDLLRETKHNDFA